MAAVQEIATADSADTRTEIGIPKFVKVPDGLKKENGKLVEDENGDPIENQKTLYVKRTGDALKEIIERAESEQVESAKRKDSKEKLTPEEESAQGIAVAKENISFVYEALAMILVDPLTEKTIDAEWLSGRLDFDVAGVWMEMFVPSLGSRQGNSSASEPGLSTDTSTLEPEQPALEESTL